MAPTTTQNPTKVATKWALIYLLAAIILTYAYQYLNIDLKSPVRYFSYLFFIGFLFLTQKEYRDQLGGYMTFGQGFSAGFRFGLFAGLLFGVFLYIYLGILNPDLMIKSIEDQRGSMSANGASSEQVEKGIEMGKKYGAIFAAFGTAVWFAILGAILGLIGAAIFKKEKTAFNTPDDYVDPTV